MVTFRNRQGVEFDLLQDAPTYVTMLNIYSVDHGFGFKGGHIEKSSSKEVETAVLC